MGADARRKEARKRKFEGGLRIGSCKRNLQLLPSESEMTTPMKKSEVTSQGLLALEPEDLSPVIERPVTSKSGGLGLQERKEVPAVKPHRFICFIGNAVLSKYLIGSDRYLRQSTIYRNASIYSSPLRKDSALRHPAPNLQGHRYV